MSGDRKEFTPLAKRVKFSQVSQVRNVFHGLLLKRSKDLVSKSKYNRKHFKMKIENYFEKLPNKIQVFLIVLVFPVVCLFGVLCLSGFLVLIDFILRG